MFTVAGFAVEAITFAVADTTSTLAVHVEEVLPIDAVPPYTAMLSPVGAGTVSDGAEVNARGKFGSGLGTPPPLEK
jgi:hypothetical protein